MPLPEMRSTTTSLERKRKELHDNWENGIAKSAVRRRSISWQDEYFEGTEDLLSLQKFWISNVDRDHLQFQYRELELFRPLTETLDEATAHVWLARADSKMYAVKLVTLNRIEWMAFLTVIPVQTVHGRKRNISSRSSSSPAPYLTKSQA